MSVGSGDPCDGGAVVTIGWVAAADHELADHRLAVGFVDVDAEGLAETFLLLGQSIFGGGGCWTACGIHVGDIGVAQLPVGGHDRDEVRGTVGVLHPVGLALGVDAHCVTSVLT